MLPEVIVRIRLTVTSPQRVAPPAVLTVTSWYEPAGRPVGELLFMMNEEPALPKIVPDPAHDAVPEEEIVRVLPLRSKIPARGEYVPLTIVLLVRSTPLLLSIVKLLTVAGRYEPVTWGEVPLKV